MRAMEILTAREAIARHVQWKITLELALTRREALSDGEMRQIERPGECAIGCWLVSDATREVRDTPQYEELSRAHVEFHREMLLVARLIECEEYGLAGQRLAAGGEYRMRSQHLAGAIMALDRVKRIGVPVVLTTKVEGWGGGQG